MRLAGHLWTLADPLTNAIWRPQGPTAEPWQTSVADPHWGSVRLTGLLRRHPGADTIVVVVHGLAGRHTAAYCARAAQAAEAAGASCLRLCLRGADRQGEDYYHAALTADLHAALESPEVGAHRNVHVLGYSLGGHLALRLAAEKPADERLRSVVAVCAPLDLADAARSFDERIPRPYRRHVLRNIVEIYAAVAQRRADVPAPVEVVRRVQSVRDFDHVAIVPRHGFDSVDHYYETASVAPLLGDLTVPALVVAVAGDPVVPAEFVARALPRRAANLEVFWADRGGHLRLPANLDLGIHGPLGLEGQAVAWMATTR